MDGKTLVIRISLLVIGVSLLSILIWGAMVGARGIAGQIIGFIITLVLSYFMIAGHNWARWVMTARCGFGVIFSFSSWTLLGELGTGFFSFVRLWLLLTAACLAGVCLFLVLSKRVNEHFNPSSGF